MPTRTVAKLLPHRWPNYPTAERVAHELDDDAPRSAFGASRLPAQVA